MVKSRRGGEKKRKNFTIKRNRKNWRKEKKNEQEKMRFSPINAEEPVGNRHPRIMYFLEKLVSRRKKQLLLGYRNCYEQGGRRSCGWRTVDGHRSTPVLSPPTESLSRSSLFHPGFRASGCNHRKLWRVLCHDSNGHRDPSAIALYNALHPSGEYVLTTWR